MLKGLRRAMLRRRTCKIGKTKIVYAIVELS